MFLILDTETTGVAPSDRIVSISWALFDNAGAEQSVAHHIIYPDGFTIPGGAAAVHGISTEQARRRGIPVKAALSALSADIERQVPVLFVGHNVSFDRPIVLNEYARLDTPANLAALPTFCTMKSTVSFCRIPRYNGGYKWPSLDELHRKLFGRPHTTAHDARADVLACAKCFFELRRLGVAQVPSKALPRA